MVTYEGQMKRSGGRPLVHRPVILRGSQAECVKKKKALKKVIIDKLSLLRMCWTVDNNDFLLKQNELSKLIQM